MNAEDTATKLAKAVENIKVSIVLMIGLFIADKLC